MKSPILILFIILNLLAVNLVSAMNMYDEETTESPLIQLQGDTALASCIDESSCDDICHISAHMMGLVSQITQIQTVENAISRPVLNEPFHSLTLDPPIQPPQA